MPKYVIEREIPGAGNWSAEQLKTESQVSNKAILKLEPEVQWLHSYVTDNKIYCVYIAPSEELVREHGRLSGFPVNVISHVSTVIDPTTAE